MATKKPPIEWTFDDWDEHFRTQLERYDGDSCVVDELVESGYTRELAEVEAQDLDFIKFYLGCDGIPFILSDRLASNALRDAVLDRVPDIIDALIAAAQKLRVPKKRGPTGRRVGGKYLYEQIVDLRDNEHLSWGKIALAIYGDREAETINKVKVQYRQAKKRLAVRQR